MAMKLESSIWMQVQQYTKWEEPSSGLQVWHLSLMSQVGALFVAIQKTYFEVKLPPWVFISPYAAAYCPIYEGWFGKRCRYRVKRSVHSNYRFTWRKIITNFTPECGQQSSNFRDASNGTCCRFGDNIIVNSSFLAVNDGWSVVSLSRMKKVNFRV
jgi:hypothetical protein